MCRSSQEGRVIVHCCEFDIQCVALVRRAELLFIAVSFDIQCVALVRRAELLFIAVSLTFSVSL